MTSDKQNQANQSNAQHSTGPTTAKGLATSSQNARKHGANAKHLVDADEIALYDNIIASLKEKYPSDNPLIGMQLSRIAKLNVQLARIQQFIDASFRLSEPKEMGDEALMEALEMTEEEKRQAKKLAAAEPGYQAPLDQEILEVNAEVSQTDTASLKTQQDFLTHVPKLCRYLFERASIKSTNVSNYVRTNLRQQLSGKHFSHPFLDELLKQLEDAKRENARLKSGGTPRDAQSPSRPSEMEALIKSTPIRDLQDAGGLIQEIVTAHLLTNHKLYTFTQARKIEHNPLPLEYESLDKLFRYQTSIQRQLSSAIGELLVLNKSY